MIRFIAKVAAKISFRWKQELEAGTNDIAAALATRNAQEKRDLVARLTKEADELDARIKDVSDMEEKGFWLCEDGHEQINEYTARSHWTKSSDATPVKRTPSSSSAIR